jgi:mono/diheme cytochrome c family protein
VAADSDVRGRARSIGRILLWTIAGIAVLVAAMTLYSLVGYRRVRPVPLPGTQAVTDADVIARGRYLVYGPGRCADCHVADNARAALERGEDAPLTGGSGEHTFLGVWTAPNLTPDLVTGLGRVSDGQIARMIRTGVNRDGRIALPFMDTAADMTEADIIAIVSFLRSLPPAPGVAPNAQVNLLGKVALTYFIGPYGPTMPIRSALTPEPTAAYGEYLARTVAGCGACHTARNLRTGAYLSPTFSGGLAFKSRLQPGYMYVSPNLTPDPATGRITNWTEEFFIARFRAGAIIPDVPMPWPGFQHMTDDDLRALYRFLRTLTPVIHDTGPSVQPLKGDAAG